MSFELIVHPSAKRDIAEADAYYAQFGKADAFIERTRAVVLAVHHQRRDPASRPRR